MNFFSSWLTIPSPDKKKIFFCITQHRIVADNIDLTINARIQTKDHVNRSLHWTHQYAVLDKVADSSCDSRKPQKSISDLQFIDFLPDSFVQTNLVWQWAVLVSRVVTKYLPAFKVFRKNVIFHIPHKYIEEMAQKSEMVCALTSSTTIQTGRGIGQF